MSTPPVAAHVEQGRAALESFDWAGAQDCFERARAGGDTAEVLDGLGQAHYWQGDYPQALELGERAYALYRGAGDRPAAAVVAVRLAMLHGLIYANGAAVSGWLGHAEQVLEGCEECGAHGWVELFRACITGDAAERERRAGVAVEIGRRHGEPGLEFDALGYLGKAHVERGAVSRGMALIDQAAAATTSRLVADPWAVGEIYCTLFHACEIALDVPRAEGWLATVDNYVERTGELPISGICRMHYGGLLTAAGRWDDADHELTTALEIYDGSYRGSRFEPLLRLADLRVRQGRLEEARRMLDGSEDRAEAVLPYARLLLATGEPELAATVLHRRVVSGPPVLPAVPRVALAVEVDLARGDVGAAHTHAGALDEVATSTGLASVRGFAARSAARIASARGEGGAVQRYEEALAAFADAELAHELAVTKLELARLLAGDRPAVARSEARGALDAFQRIGAPRDADAAASLLRSLGERSRPVSRSGGALTARQREVLALVSEGLSNADIAARLHISPRTAEHHVSNILAALGLASRTEAAAYVLRRDVSRGG